MFTDGGEVYGIGTIIKLYAMAWPEALFVVFGEGPLLEWLETRKARLLRVKEIRAHAAGASAKTLARFPAMLNRATRGARELAPQLRDEGITHIQTQRLAHQLVGGCLRRDGFKVAWQINNNSNRSRLLGFGTRLNHLMARWGADLLLPASDFVGDNWRGSGVPTRTVHNAATVLYDGPPELATTPPLRCLTAGRLTRAKGHHVAVRAVAALRDAGRDVRLDCFGAEVSAGDALYAEELRALAGQHLNHGIRFIGFEPALRSHHRDYDLGLQCRLDPEPCSLWVCEAMVDGLPLLASATGGTPELVREHETGLLYAPGDESQLADQLNSVVDDPNMLRAWQVAAYARGQTDYTMTRFAERTAAAWMQAG